MLAKDPIINVRLVLSRLMKLLVTAGFYQPPALRPLAFDQMYLSLLSDSEGTIRELLANPQFESLLSSAVNMRSRRDTLSRSTSTADSSPVQTQSSIHPPSSPIKVNGILNGGHQTQPPLPIRSRSRSLSAESEDTEMFEEVQHQPQYSSSSSPDFEDLHFINTDQNGTSPTDASYAFPTLRHQAKRNNLHIDTQTRHSTTTTSDDDFVKIDVDS